MFDDAKSNIEVIGVTSLALGQVFVGTCDGDCTEAIVSAMAAVKPADLSSPHTRSLALGLALLYLGKQQAAEAS